MQDVVHHAARVADLEAAGLDSADRGRPDYRHVSLVRLQDELARHVLRDALGYDGDRLDLGKLERLDGAVVGRAQRGERYHHVGVRVLRHRVLHVLEGRYEYLGRVRG